MTSEYSALNGDEETNEKIRTKLVDLAIQESDNLDQQQLLCDINNKYFQKFDEFTGESNRNNLDHEVVLTNEWTKDDFRN
ncbi:hypothetical protein CT113_10760 [Levilactobacillus brevis]|uniref:hypothetical protein n=1 Tax=Levilactobacillus brevis TaxID=1580 RepID=UPI00040FE518|nr:hypothetical protein [Levilactobacillus brevis]ARN93414.1 hypothetical protein AZI11_11185 [Levilactobacillus brevis]ARN96014.1 hypothetical protein AZI12_11220 [Levilactobacillus brevis]ATU70778.1 hypothetical protein CT113_10760 [Levilactobacillus brevis]